MKRFQIVLILLIVALTMVVVSTPVQADTEKVLLKIGGMT